MPTKNVRKMTRQDAIHAIMGVAIEAIHMQQYAPNDVDKIDGGVLLRVTMGAIVALGVSEFELTQAIISAPYLDMDPTVVDLMLKIMTP